MNKTAVGIALFIFIFGVLIYATSNAKTKKATEIMSNAQITIVPEETASVASATDENGGEDMNDQSQKLVIEELEIGSGSLATKGKRITVHYTGTLTDGTKFDSSVDRGTPFSFTLGAGEVIQGWDQGFDGMKVGGKRKLTIPASLGYGNRPVGSIPANSTLIFEVELLKVD